MGSKKNNDYYLKRLAAHHPQVYADYVAGKHKTVKEARKAAGTISERTRLHELKNAWRKATASERVAFDRWVKAGTPAPAAHAAAIGPDRKLASWAALRVVEIKQRRGIEMGQVMREIGVSPLDQSLSMAVRNGTRVRPALAALLEAWLNVNAGV